MRHFTSDFMGARGVTPSIRCETRLPETLKVSQDFSYLQFFELANVHNHLTCRSISTKVCSSDRQVFYHRAAWLHDGPLDFIQILNQPQVNISRFYESCGIITRKCKESKSASRISFVSLYNFLIEHTYIVYQYICQKRHFGH